VWQPQNNLGNLRPIHPANGKDGPGLDNDLEQLAAFVIKIEQISRQDQMPGGRNGKEFGDAFDDAQNQGFEQEQQIHDERFRVAKTGILAAWRAGLTLQRRQPGNGLLARLAAHFKRRLQTRTKERSFDVPPKATAQIVGQVKARLTRRFSLRMTGHRRRNRWRNTASGAAEAANFHQKLTPVCPVCTPGQQAESGRRWTIGATHCLETRMDKRSSEGMAEEWRKQWLSGQALCRTSTGAASRAGTWRGANAVALHDLL
jgi:hypothetical protein